MAFEKMSPRSDFENWRKEVNANFDLLYKQVCQAQDREDEDSCSVNQVVKGTDSSLARKQQLLGKRDYSEDCHVKTETNKRNRLSVEDHVISVSSGAVFAGESIREGLVCLYSRGESRGCKNTNVVGNAVPIAQSGERERERKIHAGKSEWEGRRQIERKVDEGEGWKERERKGGEREEWIERERKGDREGWKESERNGGEREAWKERERRASGGKAGEWKGGDRVEGKERGGAKVGKGVEGKESERKGGEGVGKKEETLAAAGSVNELHDYKQSSGSGKKQEYERQSENRVDNNVEQKEIRLKCCIKSSQHFTHDMYVGMTRVFFRRRNSRRGSPWNRGEESSWWLALKETCKERDEGNVIGTTKERVEKGTVGNGGRETVANGGAETVANVEEARNCAFDSMKQGSEESVGGETGAVGCHSKEHGAFMVRQKGHVSENTRCRSGDPVQTQRDMNAFLHTEYNQDGGRLDRHKAKYDLKEECIMSSQGEHSLKSRDANLVLSRGQSSPSLTKVREEEKVVSGSGGNLVAKKPLCTPSERNDCTFPEISPIDVSSDRAGSLGAETEPESKADKMSLYGSLDSEGRQVFVGLNRERGGESKCCCGGRDCEEDVMVTGASHQVREGNVLESHNLAQSCSVKRLQSQGNNGGGIRTLPYEADTNVNQWTETETKAKARGEMTYGGETGCFKGRQNIENKTCLSFPCHCRTDARETVTQVVSENSGKGKEGSMTKFKVSVTKRMRVNNLRQKLRRPVKKESRKGKPLYVKEEQPLRVRNINDMMTRIASVVMTTTATRKIREDLLKSQVDRDCSFQIGDWQEGFSTKGGKTSVTSSVFSEPKNSEGIGGESGVKDCEKSSWYPLDVNQALNQRSNVSPPMKKQFTHSGAPDRVFSTPFFEVPWDEYIQKEEDILTAEKILTSNTCMKGPSQDLRKSGDLKTWGCVFPGL